MEYNDVECLCFDVVDHVFDSLPPQRPYAAGTVVSGHSSASSRRCDPFEPTFQTSVSPEKPLQTMTALDSPVAAPAAQRKGARALPSNFAQPVTLVAAPAAQRKEDRALPSNLVQAANTYTHQHTAAATSRSYSSCKSFFSC